VDILTTSGGFANVILVATRLVAKIYAGPLMQKKLIKKLYVSDKLAARNQIALSHSFCENNGENNFTKPNLFDRLYSTIMRRKPPDIDVFY
jgi:hypothetical protein